MVQVITGHLVKSYDEEFRTLYARSTVPAELCPPEGLFQLNGPHGQILPKCAPHAAQNINRRDQLRHTLDTVYRKTCERRLGTRDLEGRLFEEELEFGPVVENGIGAQNHMPHFQSAEMANFLKRHSYAGERQDGGIPHDMRCRASNWNISRDMGNGTNNYHKDNYLQITPIYGGQSMRQPYNCNDEQVLSMQQNMPTLENTSKSFMRTWRIESYLKNPDIPFGDSSDYLDQFEPQDNSNGFMQGRMRSSLVFRSTIPEQMEPNRHINSMSSCVRGSAAPNTPAYYSSTQWNQTAAAESRMNNDEFMLKRQSLQILDDSWNNTSYGPGRNPYHSVYTSLGRAKGGQMIKNPDIMTDNWHKRHSVADPRSNTEYAHESSSHMYGAFARLQVNRSAAGINAQNGGYGLNLNEDQRSVSHYDVKNIKDTKGKWQEPPARSVSAAVLDANNRDLTVQSNSSGSQHFLKKSSKKIKSLLNIPEKKQDSSRTMETPSVTSEDSTDTITENEEKIKDRGGKHYQSTTSSIRSCAEGNQLLVDLKYSKPRFRTEEYQHPPQMSHKSARPGLDQESWSKDKGAENHMYNRYESLCTFEKKHPLRYAHSFRSQDKNKNLQEAETAIEHNLTRAARGHHENKLEKFFQRVGNLIHKNKQ